MAEEQGKDSSSSGANFKSYQARQNLEFVQERPKFIQEFMQRSGLDPHHNSPARKDESREIPDFEDEMPLMVDSEGNVIFHEQQDQRGDRQLPDSQDAEEGDEAAFLAENLKEFEHEVLDPSEVTRQPALKRGKPELAVRSRPKAGLKDSRLLSFTGEDDGQDE